jgi:glucosamine-6-phosphate deaminase
MRVVILDNPHEISRRAADILCQAISQLPTCVLGLATGSTPLGTYQELIQRHQAGQVHFGKVSTFNLDEYVGLTREHEQSYWYFMCKNLFEQADFQLERCFIPEGSAANLATACQRYEQLIAQAGGIDVQLLGIGTDGHIAFNEPGSSLASRTRIKALTEQTRQDNARFFKSLAEVPKLALTMGVGTILEARHIVLLATGNNKSAAVKALVEGPVTAQVPASALQFHPRVTVLLDQGSAQALSRVDYYLEVEKIQRQLDELSASML